MAHSDPRADYNIFLKSQISLFQCRGREAPAEVKQLAHATICYKQKSEQHGL